MGSIEVVLLDIGGTLRQTTKDPRRRHLGMKKLLSYTGLDYSIDELDQLLCSRFEQYRKWANETLTELSVQVLWKDWIIPELNWSADCYDPIALNRIWREATGERTLIPKAGMVVKELFNRGYRLGIVSNTTAPNEVPDALREGGIIDLFDTIILSCTFGKRKPDPSIFHAAMDAMMAEPEKCVYVGDRLDRDINGSLSAGIPTSVLIDDQHGSAPADNDLTIKPTYWIKSLEELLDILPPLFTSAKSKHSGAGKPGCQGKWNVSISTMWSNEHRMPIPDFAEFSRSLDISGIELNHQLKSADLVNLNLGEYAVRSIHEPCPADVPTSIMGKKDWLVSSEDDDKRRQAVRMIKRTIDLAKRLDIQTVVVHPGSVTLDNRLEHRLRELFTGGQKETEEFRSIQTRMRDDRNRWKDPHLKAVTESLTELLDYTSGSNVRLALENRYHFMDIPGTDEMERLLELDTKERLGMQFDVGHAHVLDVLGFYPLMDWINRFSERIIGVHIHDVVGVTDHYAPGKGDIDYLKFASRIPRTALRTLEVRGKSTRQEILESLELLARTGMVERC